MTKPMTLVELFDWHYWVGTSVAFRLTVKQRRPVVVLQRCFEVGKLRVRLFFYNKTYEVGILSKLPVN